MQRDSQTDEDGGREHQSTKARRRDGSALLMIHHLRSSRRLQRVHSCISHVDVRARAYGALHLEHKVGGALCSASIHVVSASDRLKVKLGS